MQKFKQGCSSYFGGLKFEKIWLLFGLPETGAFLRIRKTSAPVLVLSKFVSFGVSRLKMVKTFLKS